MSARRCADNLLHAAVMDTAGADPARAWPLPVLRLSIEEVVEALNKRNSEHQARCDSMREELLSYLTDFLRILD